MEFIEVRKLLPSALNRFCYFRKSQWAKFSATYTKDCPLVVAYNNLKEHRKGKMCSLKELDLV